MDWTDEGTARQARGLKHRARHASPLARRPYDLRHAGVSLALNAGVSATEVARRAGNSVVVLLKIYAHCIDGQADAANKRITDASAAMTALMTRARMTRHPYGTCRSTVTVRAPAPASCGGGAASPQRACGE